MTREEAIAVLRREIEPSVYEDEKSIAEALNMAIEALSVEPPWDSISRYDTKDKAKEIIYSILDDTDYDDIESMAHACVMMKIKILKMFDEFPSTDMVSREDFEPVDNKPYLNPVCKNCKHSSYCNNIPTDENNEDIEYYDAYGRSVLSVGECKDYEPESK